MKILLDTHIALWAIADTAKLSAKTIKLLESKDNGLHQSIMLRLIECYWHKAKYEKLKLITHNSTIQTK